MTAVSIWWVAQSRPSQRRPLTIIAVHYDASNLPIFEGRIADKKLRILLDLGSTDIVKLMSDVLDGLDYNEVGTGDRMNFRGTIQKARLCAVPDIHIGASSLSKVVARITSEDWESRTAVDSAYFRSYDAALGLPIIHNRCTALDFKADRFIILQDRSLLSEVGYDLDDMIPCDLLTSRFLLVNASTEAGEFRLVLDTGCSVNVLRSKFLKNLPLDCDDEGDRFWASNDFEIAGAYFGEVNFYPLDLPEEWPEVDGIIGMSFFRKHTVVIDHSNSTVYFDSP